MSKNYGFFRPKGSKYYFHRKAWEWGLKEEWIYDMPELESADVVFWELEKEIPAELLEKALDGGEQAIALIRATIWGEA